MPKTGEDADHADMLAAHADRNKAAWQRTLDDMRSLEAELERDGWDVLAVAAGHTAPKPRDAGDTDEYGLVHVVPGNHADDLRAAFEECEFPRYEVYLGATESRAFLVTELLDPDARRAVLLAGNYRRYDARGLVRTVAETGTMYTRAKKLDGTRLGAVEHDDPWKFFPPADREAYAP